MKFTDLFKKKNVPMIIQNRLESLLEESASNPAARPEFLRQLFQNDLFALGGVSKVSGSEESVRFYVTQESDGKPYISVFTSEAFLRRAVSENNQLPKSYIGLSATSLFSMVQNKMGIHLNPGMSFGNIFSPSEVALVLNDQLVKLNDMTLNAGDSVSVGVPNALPNELMGIVKDYVSRKKEISNVYFGLHQISTDAELAYRLAVDFSDDHKPANPVSFFKDIGTALNELKLDYPVDMLVASEQDRDLYKKGAMVALN